MKYLPDQILMCSSNTLSNTRIRAPMRIPMLFRKKYRSLWYFSETVEDTISGTWKAWKQIRIYINCDWTPL